MSRLAADKLLVAVVGLGVLLVASAIAWPIPKENQGPAASILRAPREYDPVSQSYLVRAAEEVIFQFNTIATATEVLWLRVVARHSGTLVIHQMPVDVDERIEDPAPRTRDGWLRLGQREMAATQVGVTVVGDRDGWRIGALIAVPAGAPPHGAEAARSHRPRMLAFVGIGTIGLGVAWMWWRGRGSLGFVLVWAACLILVIGRFWPVFGTAPLFDDGFFLAQQLDSPSIWRPLKYPHRGWLYVVLRLAVGLALALGDLEWAPLLMQLGAAASFALVGAWLLRPAFGAIAPIGMRVTVAIAFLLTPAFGAPEQAPVWFAALHFSLQALAGLVLAEYVLADEEKRRRWKRMMMAILPLFVLSSPGLVALVPFMAVVFVLRREWPMAGSVSGAAALQIVTYMQSDFQGSDSALAGTMKALVTAIPGRLLLPWILGPDGAAAVNARLGAAPLFLMGVAVVAVCLAILAMRASHAWSGSEQRLGAPQTLVGALLLASYLIPIANAYVGRGLGVTVAMGRDAPRYHLVPALFLLLFICWSIWSGRPQQRHAVLQGLMGVGLMAGVLSGIMTDSFHQYAMNEARVHPSWQELSKAVRLCRSAVMGGPTLLIPVRHEHQTGWAMPVRCSLP